ncbi:MAG: CBS domain-containing protein [Burkholderiales bacterium]|nr:CBS domain-containing protein [Burkholderiales bacterium]
MPISECCNIGVVCCKPEDSIPYVAGLMRQYHVGDVVVVRQEGHERIPLGIVTDRDIVVETIAPEVDMGLVTAGDIMSTPLVTVREDEGFAETLRMMREHKIRRLPVVAENGGLRGIVTTEDIINLLTLELSMVSMAMAEQPVAESHLRR